MFVLAASIFVLVISKMLHLLYPELHGLILSRLGDPDNSLSISICYFLREFLTLVEHDHPLSRPPLQIASQDL